MTLFFAFMSGMVVMFIVTYIMVWVLTRYTNPGVRYRENSEYHRHGMWMVFGYIISSVGFRLIAGDDISVGYTAWVLFSGIMVWISTIMAMIDSDSGSSLFNR